MIPHGVSDTFDVSKSSFLILLHSYLCIVYFGYTCTDDAIFLWCVGTNTWDRFEMRVHKGCSTLSTRRYLPPSMLDPIFSLVVVYGLYRVLFVSDVMMVC